MVVASGREGKDGRKEKGRRRKMRVGVGKQKETSVYLYGLISSNKKNSSEAQMTKCKLSKNI